ncbi:Vacuolar protein sorting-associated protein 51 [Madurella mycetomatis]|uniref:Vacuolar protein sorting-associated protein 51 homolog n=1 Tax=Madurella mycetomatis TaxID=100816 RepID=A0A175WB92_9PEZI|nr:Vacuolar protein sorting-associated protein 51 [Madurella mycetomatis]
MSTIASPRDPSAPFPRRANSSQALITPTSSSRPSLDVPASASSSPNPNQSSTSTNKRANRAALREYYNLRNNNNNSSNKPLPSTPPPPTVEITDHPDGSLNPTTSALTAELDSPAFNPAAYTTHLLATSSLADLLRTYTHVLSEMRALDAEKKALVYDNYSKLISATETIRRMRATMDEGGGGGGEGGAWRSRRSGAPRWA